MDLGVVLGAVGIVGSIASAVFAREQTRLARRKTQRDFGATVVADLVDASRVDGSYLYKVRVTNAGPATALDVLLDLVEWADEREGRGFSLDHQDVAPALQRGEQREVVLRVPTDTARFDDRGVAYELTAYYQDDNGFRTRRLALVFENSLLQLPLAEP